MTGYTDLELFRKALIEARNQKVDEALREAPEAFVPSEEYLTRMRRLIAGKREHKLSRKAKWIIALAAALLVLLVGCAAYVYRQKIADFIESIHQDHATVVSDEEPMKEGTAVTEFCTLTYVPEGYTLIAEDTIAGVTQIWKKTDDNRITFNQHPMNTLNFLDIERSYSKAFSVAENTVYYRSMDFTNSYIWTDNVYVYKLIFSYEVSEDEVIKIIENIQVRQ